MDSASYDRAIECAAKQSRDNDSQCEGAYLDPDALTLLAAMFCRSESDISDAISALIERQRADEKADEAEREADDNCGGGVDERGCYCGKCKSQWSATQRRIMSQDEGDSR